jgi:hypothetical protein
MNKMNSLVSSKLPPYVDEITLLVSSDVEYRIESLHNNGTLVMCWLRLYLNTEAMGFFFG